jgi:uncharacterized protein
MHDARTVKDSVFRIGRVISVDGRQVRVRVDKAKNTSHLLYRGELIRNVAVGSYIKIIKGFTRIVGKVEGEFVREDKNFLDKKYTSKQDKILRELSVTLLGFFRDGSFERGIKELPLLDNECFLLDRFEFNQVHHFIKPGDEPLIIGSLSLEKGQPISVGVNSLFTSHIGIFGNTGSGKSYTLAKIYRELFEKFKQREKFRKLAKFYLLDFNGEYIGQDAITDRSSKNVYDLSTAGDDGAKFPINESAINESGFWSILLTATEKTQAPFLDRALRYRRFAERFGNEEQLKELIVETLVELTSHNSKVVEKSVLFMFLKELNACLSPNVDNLTPLMADYYQNLKWHSQNAKFYYEVAGQPPIYPEAASFFDTVIRQKVARLKIDVASITYLDKIWLRIIFKFFDEVIKAHSNIEHIGPLLGRLDRRITELSRVVEVREAGPEQERANFTIVSFKNVNISMKKVLPLLICKQLYDQKKRANDKETFLNLIIDEAHNILSFSSERESEMWKDYRLETFEEIIKEGRKFGVFLTIASQRPSDISNTIISQLHNYFLHRLVNFNDLQAVEKTISHLDKVSAEYLSILPRGTCILAGLVTQIPVVIDIGSIPKENEPDSQTMKLIEHWKD